jgi:glutamyl-tRNA synthetase
MLEEHPPHQWEEKIRELLVAASDRIKVGGDILNYTEFFCLDAQLAYEPEALAKAAAVPHAAALLRAFRQRLAAAEPFDPSTLDRLTHELAEAEGVKLGELIQVIRVAVSGKTIGVGLYELMAILGQQSCLARVDRALGQLEAQ